MAQEPGVTFVREGNLSAIELHLLNKTQLPSFEFVAVAFRKHLEERNQNQIETVMHDFSWRWLWLCGDIYVLRPGSLSFVPAFLAPHCTPGGTAGYFWFWREAVLEVIQFYNILTTPFSGAICLQS